MDAFFSSNFFIMSLRLLLALLLSGIIGFEREINKHSAGLRTHILVGVSSCLMMLLSLYGFQDILKSAPDMVRFDPARIPSYVVSGIGFLGAGTIIVTGMTVKGLTTAASIWAVAGLGLVVGIGMIEIAILTTIIIFFSLYFLNKIEIKMINQETNRTLEIMVKNTSTVDQIFLQFSKYDLTVRDIVFKKDLEDGMIIKAELDIGKNVKLSNIYEGILNIDEVEQIQEVSIPEEQL